ncbi:hypothetical protein SAMN04489727_5737 [Amycolatopsis tolypomycina]|uniref:DUF7426 domain-containing protein n=1 Tax=Amycolatopsis tolypomycina TaxID=208445 RepID=A0A1H4WQQ1_9PSEU|nr:hypothetical protein [Amycolatopsis tolypomycina]SEC95370.1 hypothetical protein SAMN04489727_5737 [Amycolatopsis tolypomycina]
MTVKDLSAYLADDSLYVPLDGTTYRIPSPDALTGLKLMSIYQLSEDVELTEEAKQALASENRDLPQLVLGTGLDDLVAGGVSWVKIQRITRYALLFFTLGEEVADHAMNSGALSGEAPAPSPNGRRTRASRAGATTTRQAASTAGTTSPKKRSTKP